jgi:DNA repair protein RecN (Recombination protein N)
MISLSMLRELAVQNLALIEDVRVELEAGFCAWTGETGAGKTLLLEALGLLLGERGSAELLRAGANELRVTGRFELERPDLRLEIERLLDHALTEDEIILARRLTRAGRSYAYVNDQPVSVALLRQVGAALVDIHGQRESHSLLQPAYQLELLDAYGQLEELRQRYQSEAETVRELRRQREKLAAERQQRQRDLSLLRFEREELENAALKSGELDELVRERERLVHAQALQTFAAEGMSSLYEAEGSIVEQLGKLQREAESWIRLEPELAEFSRRLDVLGAEVQDLARTLAGFGQRWESDPNRLEEVERRLQLLRRLEVKYGRSMDELIAYHATLDEQERRLQQQEDNLAEVGAELTQVFARLRETASELSRQRQRVAKRLTTEAQKHLVDLGMDGARLDAALEAAPLEDDPIAAAIPAAGADHLELLLAANRGEAAWPLRKVASGGELSRTLLALKTVLAAHDRVGTLIFDEIDANVGGRLGDVLGQKLAALGRSHQVICVTHLPQVASYARHHWTIRKSRQGKRTTTTIERLEGRDRLEELASMLRGEARGETTRREAEQMLEAARHAW